MRAVLIGAVAALAGAWFGGFALVHDEPAYRLQAETFAHGSLSLPPPKHPEFFAVPQVLVAPRYAAKYFPGHAALVAPFLRAGAPRLWPILAFGICAALLDLAAGGGLIGLLAAGLFAGSAWNLRFFPSLLAHCTSTAAGAAALVLISRGKSTRSAAGAGAAIGVAFLARPFTGIACAMASVLVLLLQKRGLKPLLAFATPIAVSFGLLLAYDRAITGDALLTPWRLYAMQYAPADGPGIGPSNPPAPLLGRPAHLRPLFEEYEQHRARYTVARLPAEIGQRLDQLVDYLPWRPLVALLALAPAVVWGPEAIFALVWLCGVFLLQLSFHGSLHQYHVDEYAPLALLLAFCLAAIARGPPRPRLALAALIGVQLLFYGELYETSVIPALVLIPAAAAAFHPRAAAIAVRTLALAGLVIACMHIPYAIAGARRNVDYAELNRKFASVLDDLRGRNALLFVRGTPRDLLHLPLTGGHFGGPEPLVAVDQGDRDALLLAEHPEMKAYVVDVSTWTVQALAAH